MSWVLAVACVVLAVACWLADRRYQGLLRAVRRLAQDGKVDTLQTGKAWSVYLQELKGQRRKEKQRTLREKNDLKGVLQFLPSPVWIQDKQGMVLRGNGAFCELLGKDFEPDFYWNLIETPELFRFVDSFDEGKKNTQNIKLGDAHFVAGGSPLPSGGKLFVLQDISQLYELQLLKKDLLINISHELKTPLTTISGFLELLPAEDNKVLTILKRNAERLKSLVDDILQLASMESAVDLELEQVDLVEVVQESKLLFPESKIPIQTRFSAPVIKIEADFFRLQQVVVNLLSNAVKYTQHGKIVVEVGSSDTQTYLLVEDTGVGISAENLPKIFQRFFVGDRSRAKTVDNTGLGLAIVKSIVEKHGWSIAVESQLAVGTKVRVNIPH